MSEQTTCRTTYKEKLRPTAAQERALDEVLQRCRVLYNAALEQRITAWRRCRVSVTRSQQEAELKAIRADFPAYAAIHRHVLQEVLARLDRTYQAFFRRVANGEQPGFPRFQGRARWHSFTYKEYGNGARLDNGCLVLSNIGRLAVRWSRPIAGTPKTVTLSKEADGWYVCCSCADVPTQPLPRSGRATGIDVGLQVFLVTADGDAVANPRHYRKAERELKKAQQRVSRREKGSHRRKKAVQLCAKRHQHVRRQRTDFHHKTALALVRQYDVIDVEDIQPTNLSRRPAPLPDGHGGYFQNGASRKAGLNKSIHDAGGGRFLPSSRARQQGPASEWKRSPRRTPRRTAAAVGSASRKASPCAPLSARPVAWSWTATSTRPGTSYGADSAFGDSRGCPRGRTENPSGFRPCGVSESD